MTKIDQPISTAVAVGLLLAFASGAGLAQNLAEAVNTPFVQWYSGGNTNPTYWLPDTTTNRVDGLSGVSGLISGDQVCWVETTVHGATNVSFWWQVSSEEDFDFLFFYTNGVEATFITGEQAWVSNSFELPEGTNTLRWSYEKDGSFDEGLDRGWVDEISFSPAIELGPLSLDIPVLTNGQAHFTLNSDSNLPIVISYSTNLGAGGWTQLLSTNTISTTTVITDKGATNSPSRFYRASSPAYPATIHQ